MPTESKNQQQAAGIALKTKRAGKCDSLPEGSASRKMCDSMTIEELEKFAGTKHKGLPKKKKKANYKHAQYFS